MLPMQVLFYGSDTKGKPHTYNVIGSMMYVAADASMADGHA